MTPRDIPLKAVELTQGAQAPAIVAAISKAIALKGGDRTCLGVLLRCKVIAAQRLTSSRSHSKLNARCGCIRALGTMAVIDAISACDAT